MTGNNALEDIRAIASATPGPEQERLIEEFIGNRKMLFRRIGAQACHTYGYNLNNHLDDAASMTAMVAMDMIRRSIANPAVLDQIFASWEGLLRKNARTKIREFMDKNSAPASRMSGLARRRRTLQDVRDRLRQELQAEPTDKQVVETHNREMIARRADAAKQSMLATVDDLRTSRSWSEIKDEDQATDGGDDFVLHPSEGPKFLARLRARCAELDRVAEQKAKSSGKTTLSNPLTVVADAWFGPLYANDFGDPQVGSTKDIVEALGIPRTSARKYIYQVREAAMALAVEEYGITSADV